MSKGYATIRKRYTEGIATNTKKLTRTGTQLNLVKQY